MGTSLRVLLTTLAAKAAPPSALAWLIFGTDKPKSSIRVSLGIESIRTDLSWGSKRTSNMVSLRPAKTSGELGVASNTRSIPITSTLTGLAKP